ncbi:MAG: VOC family protein [Bacteroidales bacterium]|nr:VOC family protein [Bacteroidales bacterium]MBR4002201.1 VOC family protein [Bacteroidales bacterium]
MADFSITGIQQVGVGTVNFRKSWNWFIEMFGMDIKILEDDTVAERMLPYTGGQPQKRHACIAVNLQGGGGLEIWQYSQRKPVSADFDISVGDLGIFAAKVKSRNVEAFHSIIREKWDGVGDISSLPDGTPCFYVKDLYGNCFQVVENQEVYIEQNRMNGGIFGAVVGVSDMDASILFYKDVLGYDTLLYDTTGIFDDWNIMPGCTERYRRVLLAPSGQGKGAFAGLMGKNTIELVQALDHTPRKIFEGRQWGDPGFIQICFDVCGTDALGAHCAALGHPFTVDSCPDGQKFNMGDAAGRFTYIEDPDGTLIEFVETEKVPVVKKLGWFIDLKKRDPQKELPKFLFRLMGLVSREKIK